MADLRASVEGERRQHTRKRLLTAVMGSYAERDSFDRPVIEDVIKRAAVTRATFYSHFLSLDEAVSALGEELAEDMIRAMAASTLHTKDPLLRMATGIQIFLLRGLSDADWGSFVCRTDFLSKENVLLKMVETDLRTANDQKILSITDLHAATDLFVGTLVGAIRHLQNRETPNRLFVEDISIMMLRGIGVNEERARDAVRDRAIFIRGLGPESLPWLLPRERDAAPEPSSARRRSAAKKARAGGRSKAG